MLIKVVYEKIEFDISNGNTSLGVVGDNTHSCISRGSGRLVMRVQRPIPPASVAYGG